MPRIQPPKPSFNAGEISDRLVARTDFAKYPNAVEIAENVIPLGEGGLLRRPGTRYVSEEVDSTVKGRLKSFEFSTTQAYIIEMGNQIFRFYRNQGRIDAGNITASITNGDFPSGIANWDDRSTGGAGNQISHDATNNRLTLETNGTAADDIGWAEQQVTNASAIEHVLKFQVIGAPSDRVELRIGTTSTGSEIIADFIAEVGYHCYSFTATAADFYIQFRNRGNYRNKDVQIDNVSLIDNTGISIDTPYTEAQLYTVEGPQSADVLYLFHDAHPTYKLERRGHARWALVEVAWQDGPYLAQNSTSTTLTFTAATGLGIDCTASSVDGINGGAGFTTNDIGRLIRLTDSASLNWGWGVIVSITSTTVCKVDIRRTMTVTTAETTWRLGAWSATTGYPRGGTFFEQRLWCFGSDDQPQSFWASNTADFENMAPDSVNSGAFDGTVEDDDALDFTLSADNVNAIQWMNAGEASLAIGTLGGEWTPSSVGAVITPSDITVVRNTTHGSARIQPVRVGRVVLFVQRAKRKLWELGFSFEADGLDAFDMTRLAYHVTFGGIVEMAFQEEPHSLVWVVRDDGQLLSMTFRREEDVVGWARHKLGGVFYASIDQVWQVDDSEATFVDETTDANSAANGDWAVFPTTEAVGDYVAIGESKTFSKVVFDYANGTAGTDGVVVWEYWDGTAWSALTGVSDGTTGFTAAKADNLVLTFTEPTDWKKRVLSSGAPRYYIRARITTVYTVNPLLDQGYVPSDAVVESIATIPGTNGAGQTQDSTNRDEVWVAVKRTINGATKRYVEFMERDFETGHDQEDAYYSDSLITYDSTSTTTITDLDHLEGETVAVWADGGIQASKTVASSQITIDTAAAVVQVGLPYEHQIKTLKWEGGNPAGTAVGRIKRIHGVTFVVLNSHLVKFGPTISDIKTLDFRVVGDPLDTPAPLFTGERFESFEGNWDMDSRVIIKDNSAAPFTLLEIIPDIDIKPMR